jgi:D-lyxose ketol-isomerase
VHAAKYNLFVVLDGKIGIKTEDGETILGPGEEFTVPPGVFHEFRVYESGAMIEEMYVEYEENDIERKDVGGDLNE